MDHAVHINGKDNGSRAAKPIVLRLLPGEETIFNLRVVNHGEPANISLLASSPVIKAVRLRKPDHYVVMEEVIPVMARMPAGKRRLDGEIVLSGPAGKSRVPITLLRDSEDPGDDMEAPGPAIDADILDGELEGDGDAEDGDDNDYEDDTDGPPRRKSRGQDDDGDEEDEGSEPRRITFSRDQDLERYRSASRRKKGAERARAGDAVKGRQRPAAEGSPEKEAPGEGPDERTISRTPPRFVTRIDDSFVDKSTGSREGPSSGVRSSGAGGGQPPQDADSDSEAEAEQQYGGLNPEWDREGRERFESAEKSELAAGFQDYSASARREDFAPGGQQWDRGRDLHPGGGINEFAGADADEDSSANRGASTGADAYRGREAEGEGDYSAQDGGDESGYGGGGGGAYGRGGEGFEDREGSEGGERGDLLGRLDGLSLGSLQIIPAAIFLALVAVLILTFIMGAIPEFAGALASSILIVTLIIYGAAILLKA